MVAEGIAESHRARHPRVSYAYEIGHRMAPTPGKCGRTGRCRGRLETAPVCVVKKCLIPKTPDAQNPWFPKPLVPKTNADTIAYRKCRVGDKPDAADHCRSSYARRLNNRSISTWVPCLSEPVRQGLQDDGVSRLIVRANLPRMISTMRLQAALPRRRTHRCACRRELKHNLIGAWMIRPDAAPTPSRPRVVGRDR